MKNCVNVSCKFKRETGSRPPLLLFANPDYWFFGATSEYPATDTPSLNLQVRRWINIKLSATVVRSVLLKCYRGPQSRSGWISYGVSV